MRNEIVKYQSGGKELTLSTDIVKQYLVNGNGAITDQEAFMFLKLCERQGLDPFIKDAYCIKFGSSPATFVTAITAIRRKAMSDPNYSGHSAGIVVINRDGKLEKRKGTLILPREELVGGWCDARRKTLVDVYLNEHQVSLSEFLKVKDGRPQAQWATMPATMICKVAEAQCLRMTFDLSGMYEASEMGIDEKNLPTSPVDITKVVADITPVNTAQNVTTVTPEPSNPMRDLLDLSDADFLASNFTFNGKTKVIGQIKLEAWKNLTMHDDGDIASVAQRAVDLLDNSFLAELKDNPFDGQIQM